MNLPTTTEFTLKTIVENLNQISSRTGKSSPTMSSDMKRQLKEMASMFNEYGKAFEGEQSLLDATQAIQKFMQLAETYAIENGGDVFQENIIKQNFAEAKKKVQQLQKLAQECYVRKQQLGVLFDDIRHITNRYFKISN